MNKISAEKLAQRIFDAGLLTAKEVDAALAKAGGRGEATLDRFIAVLLEDELLTNWQIARLCEGQKAGFFYGNWKLLYLIGAGTFARVYRSVHTKTGDIKAVKVLRNRYSSDFDVRESFLGEGRLVMKLRHPNIVPIHEVDEFRGRNYMVMDFIEGQNLRDYIRAHKKLNVEIALGIIRDVLAGLEYAAQQNIYHRDIKLSNVLLSAQRQAKLVDFGLAVDTGSSDKGGPRSIDYAGLERFSGVRRNDPRSDIFFVGCMLYHMLCGEPPLLETRERMKRLSKSRFTDVTPISAVEPNLPNRVVIFLQRMMSVDIEKRHQTASQAHDEADSALRAYLAGDAEKYDASAELDEYRAQQSEKTEGANWKLMLIESDVKAQDSLRNEFKKLGYRVLITNNPERGMSRFEDLDPAEETPAHCVIFSAKGLGSQALQAFEAFALAEDTATLPAILMVPAKLQGKVKSDLLNDRRVVLPIPFKMSHLRNKLMAVLNPVSESDDSQTISDEATLPENRPEKDTDTE